MSVIRVSDPDEAIAVADDGLFGLLESARGRFMSRACPGVAARLAW